MAKKRNVKVEQVKTDKGQVIGARKTVTRVDKNDIVKKQKTKFVGDKDYLQGRREVVLRAKAYKRRRQQLDASGLPADTQRKIDQSPVVLTDKEKKNKEIIKTERKKDNNYKTVEKKGVATGSVYKSRSVMKTTKDQRADALVKQREAEKKKKEDSWRGIKSSDGNVNTKQKNTAPAEKKKRKK